MPTRRPSGHRHHVLVVDDSKDTRDSLGMLLTLEGCDVVTADSGRKTFEMFAAGLSPCMMLLDLRMPEMDGWQVWDRMKADPELAKTPVVIISGDIADPARAKAVGIRAFLRKPMGLVGILATVERFCLRA